ncbi:UDP-2,3-diacylglucosamine diphosphatase [Rhodobacteraceae bacterium XHP0102]|nr:UDP-2,3-diacylglucosamine diphosphatase [Rhodobacteraceae bacterium XHP0102]
MTENATSPIKIRSLFLSDLHMGHKASDLAAVRRVMARYEFRHLFLVGDVIDGWKLEKRWFWNKECQNLISDILHLRREARVRVTVITGNHDEKLREILPTVLRPLVLRKFGLRIEERVIHKAADGRRYLVMHGDQFDNRLVKGSSKSLDNIWSWLTEKGYVQPINPRRTAAETPRKRRWSLRKSIEGGMPLLGQSFKRLALERSRRDGLDGIICGHSHLPELSDTGEGVFANCGSWVRRDGPHHAIAEHENGQLELVEVPRSHEQSIDPDDHIEPLGPVIETYIRKLWHERAVR